MDSKSSVATIRRYPVASTGACAGKMSWLRGFLLTPEPYALRVPTLLPIVVTDMENEVTVKEFN